MSFRCGAGKQSAWKNLNSRVSLFIRRISECMTIFRIRRARCLSAGHSLPRVAVRVPPHAVVLEPRGIAGTNRFHQRFVPRPLGRAHLHTSNGVILMRRLSLPLGLLAACAATGASAETVNLTGTYRCIQMCRDGMVGAPTFVTQNGDAVNLTTEAGESYRAWPDWNAPTSRIWIEARGEGAVYSPDGMRIQFDDGRVWQRDPGPPVLVPRAPVVYSR